MRSIGLKPLGSGPYGFLPQDFPRRYILHFTPSVFAHVVKMFCNLVIWSLLSTNTYTQVMIKLSFIGYMGMFQLDLVYLLYMI